MMPAFILGISMTGKSVMHVTCGFDATIMEQLSTFKQ
jgi:hypothetical protein